MSLASQLGRALNAPPVPTDKGDLVEYAGGRRQLVELLSGLDGPPRRTSYPGGIGGRDEFEADRRRWTSTHRRVQRWTTTAGERRGTRKVELTAVQKRRIRRDANERHRALLLERGLRARMRATVFVDTPRPGRIDRRERIMPAPGSPAVLLRSGDVADVLDALGDREAAADDFFEAFMNSYGMGHLETELDSSLEVALKVWPDGEPEPAN